MWKDKSVERFYQRVCFAASTQGNRKAVLSSSRYFPTVYEPTVFENYVHGNDPIDPQWL